MRMIPILHKVVKGMRPDEEQRMSRVCQVTGATVGFGHHVSHSHRRTNRRFDINIQKKRYWVPSLGRHVTL